MPVVIARRTQRADHHGAIQELHSFLGAPPPDEWWWLGIQAPHIGTTPDLVHTTAIEDGFYEDEVDYTTRSF